jgi:hypothetical protein
MLICFKKLCGNILRDNAQAIDTSGNREEDGTRMDSGKGTVKLDCATNVGASKLLFTAVDYNGPSPSLQYSSRDRNLSKILVPPTISTVVGEEQWRNMEVMLQNIIQCSCHNGMKDPFEDPPKGKAVRAPNRNSQGDGVPESATNTEATRGSSGNPAEKSSSGDNGERLLLRGGELLLPGLDEVSSVEDGEIRSSGYSSASPEISDLDTSINSLPENSLTYDFSIRTDNRGDGEVTRMGGGESYRPTARARSPPRGDTFRSSDRDRRTPPISDSYHPGERRRSRSPGHRRDRTPPRDSTNWRTRPRSPRARSMQPPCSLSYLYSNFKSGPGRRFSPRRDDDRRERARSPRRDDRYVLKLPLVDIQQLSHT